jgi:hypothetical protein
MTEEAWTKYETFYEDKEPRKKTKKMPTDVNPFKTWTAALFLTMQLCFRFPTTILAFATHAADAIVCFWTG